MRRITTALLAAVPLAVLLAGCGPDGRGTAAPAPSTPAPAASTPEPGSTQSTGDAPPTPTSGPSRSSTASSTPRCHTADLTVTVAPDEGGGAAGTEYEVLVFRNRFRHTCTLYGYPGVSFVAGDQGTQVNAPFTRAPGKRVRITLKAGAAAHASIGLPNYQNYPAADCKPVPIRGFRVYPPDETTAVFVSQPQNACSVTGKGVGLVLPIAAGAAPVS